MAVDFTSRNFDTIKTSLENHIKTKFPNTWHHLLGNPSDIGQQWLEINAYVLDSLSYYIDSVAQEPFLTTARDRSSVFLLAQLVGYEISGATSASVTIEATIQNVQAADVIVPAGTQITTIKDVVFEFISDQTIPAGQTTANFIAVEGVTNTDNFVSNGTSYQEFQLSANPVIEGSVTVVVDTATWTQTESLTFASAVDQAYQLRRDDQDNVYVRFGDGVSGTLPPNGASIAVNFRIGGGTVGNININDIVGVQVNGDLSGSVPATTVVVSLTNKENGSGGEPRETVEHAKFWIPRHVSTNGRAVTLQDFDTLASLFTDPVHGTPAFAKARLKSRVPETNTVEIFLWSRGAGGEITAPSANLINAVQAYFDNDGADAVRLITVKTEVQSGENLFIDVNASLSPDKSVSVADAIVNASTALKSYFGLAQNQPGTPVKLSILYRLLQGSQGVEHGVITNVQASLETSEIIGTSDGVNRQYTYTLASAPVAGTISITSGGYTVTDDSNGGLIGDVDGTYTNTVNYLTGQVDFMFASPATANGTQVQAEYRTVSSILRNESDMGIATDGVTTQFSVVTKFSPIVKGTLAITDGVRTITDDGNGGFGGDVDGTGVNVIDYTTGAIQFKFNSAPTSTDKIASMYDQYLQGVGSDLPVSENQLAVEGFITVVEG